MSSNTRWGANQDNSEGLTASLEALGQALADMSPDRAGLQGFLELAAQALADGTGARTVALFSHDRDTDSLRLLHALGPDSGAGMSLVLQRLWDQTRRGNGPDPKPWTLNDGSTVMCLPLTMAQERIGALGLVFGPGQGLDPEQAGPLALHGQLLAAALDRAAHTPLVGRDLYRSEQDLDRLQRAGLLISSRRGLQETLDTILRMALEVTNAHYGIFRLVDGTGQKLVARAVAGENLGAPRMEALPMDTSSVMGWVALHRQPACIRDLREEPWSRVYYPLDTELVMRSELAVPLVSASGRLEGVLNLESPAVGAFTQQDSHLLQALATQAVIVIQEARLLDALKEVAEALLAEPCEAVLNRLVELARDLLDASASAIWTLEGDRLVLQAASASYRRGESLPLHGSLTGEAVLTQGAVRSDNLQTDPRFHRSDLAREQNWARALIVPLSVSGNPQQVGAFSVYSAGSAPGRFVESEWDEKVLTSLAHFAALAVNNAAHQAALRAAQERRDVAETFAAVGDIAANLLHHLNNKVGTIPVRIQGIRAKSQPALLADPYLAANLDEIERSALAAMEAVRENLVHLHPIHLAPVDVAACVKAALADADLPASVEVEMSGLEALPKVWAGQRSLTLVFTNLFDNAAAAMEGRGRLSVHGSQGDHGVQVHVTDDGPGIPPEMQERIFEFDAPGGGASRSGKLGFGLWWVKTLMMRLGGSVSVQSDGQHGTTFELRLPRAGANGGRA